MFLKHFKSSSGLIYLSLEDRSMKKKTCLITVSIVFAVTPVVTTWSIVAHGTHLVTVLTHVARFTDTLPS